MTDTVNYPEMIDNAMRGVVRDALKQIAATGLPGDHHFYITFRTDHPKTRVSDTLRLRYPREMTIVMQHQFWDFKVSEDEFTATLSFSGVPERLVIPYAALTAFADPSVKFGLQFHGGVPDDDLQGITGGMQVAERISISEISEEEAAGQAAEIISLDAFRKK